MDDEQDVKIESEDLGGGTGDPEFIEGQEATAESKVKKLRDDVEQLRKEKQEYLDGWQRAKADYVNALKRFDEEMKAANVGGVIKAVEALLPAYDALERAKEHGEVPEGFTGIVRQIEVGFKTLGVESVGQIGEKFNPALHESLGQDPAESADMDDTVTAVLEKGWKIGDMTIRPAKVRVAHFEKT